MGIADIEYILIFGSFAILAYLSLGGGCPRTPNRNSENLQFESVAEVSCLSQGKKCPFEGLQNSSTGMDAYKLKVEKSEIGVLGHAGGGTVTSSVVIPNTSLFLKALCCLVIVCHHFALRTDAGVLNKVLQIGGGTYALVVFLFLSSYGIAKSEIKHTTTFCEYVRHRLWKLLLPYLLVTILSIFAYYLIGANASEEELIKARVSLAFVAIGEHQISFSDVIAYIIGYKSFSGSMWFVGVTLYSYVAFGLVKCLGKRDDVCGILSKRLLILTAYTLSLGVFTLVTYNSPNVFPAHYYRNLWALWLGMFVALYEKEILFRNTMYKLLIYLVANVVMFCWLKLTSSGDQMYFIFANMAMLSILVTNKLFKKYSLKPSSVICQLAGLSYPIYLIHGKILTVEWWYMGYQSVILVILACIVLAIITNKFINYVLRK